MKITELQKNYPNIKFYELKNSSEKEFLSIKRLEDFLEFVKVVGYIETEVSSEDASEFALESVIRSYCVGHHIYKDRDKFAEFVEDNLTKKLEKLTTCKGYTSLELFSIDSNVMYAEDYCMNREDYNSAIEELESIYEKFQTKLAKEENVFDEKVKACIMDFKNEYDWARNKTEKEEVIKKIKYHLKVQYGLDGRKDYRATEFSIKQMLEMGMMLGFKRKND